MKHDMCFTSERALISAVRAAAERGAPVKSAFVSDELLLRLAGWTLLPFGWCWKPFKIRYGLSVVTAMTGASGISMRYETDFGTVMLMRQSTAVCLPLGRPI